MHNIQIYLYFLREFVRVRIEVLNNSSKKPRDVFLDSSLVITNCCNLLQICKCVFFLAYDTKNLFNSKKENSEVLLSIFALLSIKIFFEII